jgi:tRNA(fMet)-specific endonuclease VapC
MSLPSGAALLDTDILSAVMRQHPAALVHARAYLAMHHRFTFSIITHYEVLRGLHAKRATVQLTAFGARDR